MTWRALKVVALALVAGYVILILIQEIREGKGTWEAMRRAFAIFVLMCVAEYFIWKVLDAELPTDTARANESAAVAVATSPATRPRSTGSSDSSRLRSKHRSEPDAATGGGGERSGPVSNDGSGAKPPSESISLNGDLPEEWKAQIWGQLRSRLDTIDGKRARDTVGSVSLVVDAAMHDLEPTFGGELGSAVQLRWRCTNSSTGQIISGGVARREATGLDTAQARAAAIARATDRAVTDIRRQCARQ